ncbi:MAG: 3-oxoacyl-ACP synthase III family protein, partial [Thermoanaerobaculia bacterium]
MSDLSALLAGTGVAVPPCRVDNHMLARVMDTSDEWIRERSGVVTRHYVEPGTSSSDLGVEAARAALADAGVEAGEVDYIVCATLTPDYYFPGIGTIVQQKLGIGAVPSLDIRQQCAGFAYGLQMVDALVRSGMARTVLLVGTDVHTSLMPFSPRTWEVLYDPEAAPLAEEERAWNTRFRYILVLFGDAAGAMVFRAGREDGRGILRSALWGDGNHKDILYTPGGGSAARPWVTPEMIARGDLVPVMDGRQVFRLAVTLMPEAVRQLLADEGAAVEELD